jgi:hypothetical protein
MSYRPQLVRFPVASFLLFAVLAGSGVSADGAERESPAAAGKAEEIDFDKARQLLRRRQQGETLTAEEQAYLDRAREARRQRGGRRPGDVDRPTAKPFTGLVPLCDMTADDQYKGEDGGLYGGGRNTPPEEHLKAAVHEAEKIVPLDADGSPSPNGKIVMISNGMSNTTQEFSQFVQSANRDPDKSPRVQIVDCAQGGQEALDWARPEDRFRRDRSNPWEVMMQRLDRAGVSPQQVQVAWIKQARRNPKSIGEFPKHAEEMEEHLVVIINRLKERFPNLRVIYLSSRIYAGYASTPLNPEPYAYECAFTVRWLIQDQIKGVASLNYDPQRGEVKAPLLLWGPYLWADGVKGRKSDDLVWLREDLAGDGTHPSTSGRETVARQLLDFMKTDRTARPWFVNAAEQR